MSALPVPIRLGPSRLAAYEVCPRQWMYKYVLKWRPMAESANMVFGNVVHTTVTEHLHALHRREAFDPAAAFTALWNKTAATTSLSYSSLWDESSLRSLGPKLVDAFVTGWRDQGLQPLLDATMQPIIERAITVDIGDGITMPLRIDLAVLTPDGKVRVADIKTAAQPSFEGFAYVADQTLCYQFSVEAVSQEFGIDQVDEIQFIELIKQKTKPRALFSEVAPRRPDEQVEEYLTKVRQTATAIRQGRFPRKAGMAYNTPCSMCDFSGHCLSGSVADLDPKSLGTPFPSPGNTAPQPPPPRMGKAA